MAAACSARAFSHVAPAITNARTHPSLALKCAAFACGYATASENSMTVHDALNVAMEVEMMQDETVFIIGEEVAHYNGAYKIINSAGKTYYIRHPFTVADGARACKGICWMMSFLTVTKFGILQDIVDATPFDPAAGAIPYVKTNVPMTMLSLESTKILLPRIPPPRKYPTLPHFSHFTGASPLWVGLRSALFR
ncbi:hypothetical protein DFH29DRAFT_881907 [Suillus ampliporus]|nr:hypothetical protein DFH29DRAFT_881907 [Suillus ampliporus]